MSTQTLTNALEQATNQNTPNDAKQTIIQEILRPYTTLPPGVEARLDNQPLEQALPPLLKNLKVELDTRAVKNYLALLDAQGKPTGYVLCYQIDNEKSCIGSYIDERITREILGNETLATFTVACSASLLLCELKKGLIPGLIAGTIEVGAVCGLPAFTAYEARESIAEHLKETGSLVSPFAVAGMIGAGAVGLLAGAGFEELAERRGLPAPEQVAEKYLIYRQQSEGLRGLATGAKTKVKGLLVPEKLYEEALKAQVKEVARELRLSDVILTGALDTPEKQAKFILLLKTAKEDELPDLVSKLVTVCKYGSGEQCGSVMRELEKVSVKVKDGKVVLEGVEKFKQALTRTSRVVAGEVFKRYNEVYAEMYRARALVDELSKTSTISNKLLDRYMELVGRKAKLELLRVMEEGLVKEGYSLRRDLADKIFEKLKESKIIKPKVGMAVRYYRNLASAYMSDYLGEKELKELEDLLEGIEEGRIGKEEALMKLRKLKDSIYDAMSESAKTAELSDVLSKMEEIERVTARRFDEIESRIGELERAVEKLRSELGVKGKDLGGEIHKVEQEIEGTYTEIKRTAGEQLKEAERRANEAVSKIKKGERREGEGWVRKTPETIEEVAEIAESDAITKEMRGIDLLEKLKGAPIKEDAKFLKSLSKRAGELAGRIAEALRRVDEAIKRTYKNKGLLREILEQAACAGFAYTVGTAVTAGKVYAFNEGIGVDTLHITVYPGKVTVEDVTIGEG